MQRMCDPASKGIQEEITRRSLQDVASCQELEGITGRLQNVHLCSSGLQLFVLVEDLLLHHAQSQVHEEQQSIVTGSLLTKCHLNLALVYEDDTVYQRFPGKLWCFSVPHMLRVVILITQFCIISCLHTHTSVSRPTITRRTITGRGDHLDWQLLGHQMRDPHKHTRC